MSTIKTIGVDLAKNVFSIHGVNAYGKCALRKTVKRNKLLETFAKLPPCLIMEACSGAHHWARELLQDLSNKIQDINLEVLHYDRRVSSLVRGMASAKALMDF
ncbi:transposase [Vibrio cyclitrophicus ZF170]|nr:transposase [Vibrio cyclitrophicus]OEE27301.1 transposase [Vibrio cyclitrophicus ZF170]OEE28151.1 transposase [Vibrio cyclitrophicus ZF14]PMF61135.1 transposase [Vibrio cyclitrophicus]